MVLPTAAGFDYDATMAGGSVTSVSALLGAPPVPEDVLEMIGCQLVSDVLSPGTSSCARIIAAGIAAGTQAAVGPAVILAGQIASVPVVSVGSGYSAPPLVTAFGSSTTPKKLAQLRSKLKVVGANIIAGGASYVAPTLFFQGGLVPPQIDPATGFFPPCCLQSIAVVSSGLRYSANAKVQFTAAMVATGRLPAATLALDGSGRVASVFVTDPGEGIVGELNVYVWDPGPTGSGLGGGTGAVLAGNLGVGQQATATATVSAGAIHTVSITFAGGPYVTLPKIAVVDASGSSALVLPTMGVSLIEVIDPGFGYNGTVSVGLQDLFFALFPNSNAWPSAFKNLMTPALSASVMSPVVQTTPIIV
jgi:hypothetical protein